MNLDQDSLKAHFARIWSIHNNSAIPRETIRRKVKELLHTGWIIRRDKGYLIASNKAAADLAPATEATMHSLLTVVTACSEAMAGAPLPPSSEP